MDFPSEGEDEGGLINAPVDGEAKRRGETSLVKSEVIESGHPARWGRRRFWLSGGAALLLVAIVILVVSHHRPRSHPSAARPLPSTTAATTVPAPPAQRGAGVRLPIGPGAPVGLGIGHRNGTSDVLYVLLDRPPRLVQVDMPTKHRLDASIPPGPRFLIPDDDHNLVWVVSNGTGGDMQLRAYDGDTLELTADETLPYDMRSGAILDGALYLGGPAGLVELGGSGPLLLPGSWPGGGVSSLAADPAGHRLLAAPAGDPAALRIVHAGSTQLHDGPTLPVGNPSLVDVASQIWVSGTGSAHAQLLHLDPATLQPALTSQPPTSAAGDTIVGAGDFVIWAHNTTDGTLNCIDATTGNVIARFTNIQGPVVSEGVVTALVFAINAGQVITLDPPPACQG
jgi:hypothetical protein